MSLSFFYGDEEFLIEQEINKMREKLLDKNFSAMNYKYVKNVSFSDFISLLRTQPMMFGSQLIVIDVESIFAESFNDNQINEIKDAFELISPSLHIVLLLKFERNSKRKPDSRKKIYKLIEKYATLKNFPSILYYKTDEIVNFINKEAKKQGVVIEKQAGIRLAEQIGNNLREIVKEIEKLVLLAYPQTKITEKMVKDICITNEDVFVLTNKLFNGKKATALKEFRKLCDKQHPLAILAPIQTVLRQSIIIKLYEKKLSKFEIAQKIGGSMTEFLVGKKMEDLKNANIRELVRLKHNFSNAEFKIKTGQTLDAQDEIERAFY